MPRNLDTYFSGITLDNDQPTPNRATDTTYLRNRFPIPERTTLIRPAYMDTRLGTLPQIMSALPFGRAMRKLHEQVSTAEQFYTKLRDDFDSAIEQISTHCSIKLQQSIWRSRVEGRLDPKSIMRGQEERTNADVRELKGQFLDARRDLLHALHTALSSKFEVNPEKDLQSAVDYKAGRRMLDNVRLKSEHIEQLMRETRENREGCVMLLDVLEELKEMIDPEKDKNKVLFQRVENEEDDRRSTDGNVGWSDDF